MAIPTETVYGLAADATNAEAVRRIFEVKGRPSDHPLIVHLSDAGAIIMKDSSANKCGVICSSFEIMACMLLDEAEFFRPRRIKRTLLAMEKVREGKEELLEDDERVGRL